jgi:hypothetical protein
VPWFGELNDVKMADGPEAAQVTRAEGQRLEATLSEIDRAEIAGAALEHPLAAVVPARRCGMDRPRTTISSLATPPSAAGSASEQTNQEPLRLRRQQKDHSRPSAV